MMNQLNVNVLLIEDDENSRKITKEILSRSDTTNFFVSSVETLADAIEVLKSNNTYDVVILDLVLPNGEGLSVFKQVKKVCDKPIIIVSGYEDKALECVKYGAQDYLVKPHYDGRTLIRSIRYAIERHKWKSSFNKVVESTHAAIYEIDFVNMLFTYINDVALRETGYTKEEMLNMKPTDILTEESINRWFDRLMKIQNGETIDNIEEFQIKRKDGSLMWILITADYKYQDDKIIGACVIAIDITDKKEKENQIKSIYKTAPVGLGLLNLDRVITDVNDRFCEIVGYERDELIGKSAKNIYSTEKEYERVGRIKYKDIKETGIGVIETQMRKKSGELIDVLLTSAYLEDTDPSKGVTFSVLDITKTKEIEREIENELNKRLDIWKSEVGVDFQNLNRLDSIMNL